VFSSRRWKFYLCALLVGALSCARRPSHPPLERLAILRFENLGPDAATDWMGRALAEVITADLAEAPGVYAIPSARLHALDRVLGVRPISAPGISAERAQALAVGADGIGYGDYWIVNGRIEAHLTIMDPRTGKAVQSIGVSAAAGAVLDAANQMARRIADRSIAYSTRQPEAIRHYAMALEASDAAAMIAESRLAIAADPGFGPPYRTLAQTEAAGGDRAAAIATLDQALARGARMPPVERARMQFEKASLEGDATARFQALAAMAKASPADPELWRTYGQSAFLRHDYPPALEAFRQAIALEPDDVDSLNQMAYAAAYAGDLNEAGRLLRRYQALRPTDPNPLDSLGDAHLINGRLREAETFYLEAAKKNPAVENGGDYFKAAVARLMTGDVAGADALSKQFADVRSAAKDPSVDLFRAQWNWLAGRREIAAHDAETFARAAAHGPSRDLAALAWSQLAVWKLVMGDRSAAAQAAANAGGQAGPASAATVSMVRLLAEPPAAAAEWTARIERLLPRPDESAPRDFALGYALLLDKQFDAAAPVFRRMYDSGEDSANEGLPVLLAWCYLETGREKEAAAVIAWNPIPPVRGPSLFAPFYFPRLFALRAEAAEKTGRTNEANANRKIFEELAR
jgi:Flp pilus assembly protein TadD